eukprot:4177577-Pyramimonas_sp.AAC.1
MQLRSLAAVERFLAACKALLSNHNSPLGQLARRFSATAKALFRAPSSSFVIRRLAAFRALLSS